MILNNFTLKVERLTLRDGISVEVKLEHKHLPISFVTAYYSSIHDQDERVIRQKENALTLQLMNEVVRCAQQNRAVCTKIGNNKFTYTPALDKEKFMWYIINEKGERIYEVDAIKAENEAINSENPNVNLAENDVYNQL